MITIGIVNRSTLVSDADFARIVEATKLHIENRYNKSGWVKRSISTLDMPRPKATVTALSSDISLPADTWPMYLLDDLDTKDALGYHDDTATTPYSNIGVRATQSDGAVVSEVCCHEAVEALVDPWVDPAQPKMVQRPGTAKFYILEACDACQGSVYNITLSDGSFARVADFCIPPWWGLSSWTQTTEHNEAIGRFEVDPQGYMSIYENGQWSQIYGREAVHRADPDDPKPTNSWDHRAHRLHKAAQQREFSPVLFGAICA